MNLRNPAYINSQQVSVKVTGKLCLTLGMNAKHVGPILKLRMTIQFADLIDVLEMKLLYIMEHAKDVHPLSWQTIGEENV